MTETDADEHLAMIAARAEEIRTGLDGNFTKEQLQRPVSRRTVHALVAATTASTAAKLKALSARVEALEEGGIKYLGNYQRACCYAKGDAITHSGSLWIALKSIQEGSTPGSDPSCWQLAAKGGKPVKRPPAGSTSA
ncbi:UNVERIFIED_ORG: hypothetical protein GGE44_004100 [Rhizobium esperanzae]